MKRILIGALAALTAMVGVAGSAAADDHGRWHGDHGRHEGWEHGRGHYGDGYYGHGGYYGGHGYYGHGYYGGHRWYRGGYLPRGYYGSAYDWRYHRLAPPPYGYYYYRDDRTGDILMAAIATGLIVSVLNQPHYGY